MPKKQLDTLTESMYYTLIALLSPRCGIEITEFILELTHGRVRLVPGTLYTMLSKFESEGMIDEIQVEGRKRTYLISPMGKDRLKEEYERLRQMIEEGAQWMEEIK
ncbi:PadR family transcriptional regulator [[Eubacterium] hominis]|uniref:PadR family transcriptional regulator n=1 Tax=[Eubacterium] hominis TaxID=2764325 RepID=UPI003A4D484F